MIPTPPLFENGRAAAVVFSLALLFLIAFGFALGLAFG